MKRLGIYYATACFRDEQGRYYTSGGLGRYLDSILRNYLVEVHLLAPVTTNVLSHLCYPVDPRVQVYELPYFERLREAQSARHSLRQRLSSFLVQHPVDLLWVRYPAAYHTVICRSAMRVGVPFFIETVGDPVAVLKRTKRIPLPVKLIALSAALWHEHETKKLLEQAPGVAVSLYLRQRFSTPRNVSNILTLPCGSLVEEDFFTRDDTCLKAPYRVLSVARLDQQKSLHTLIDAIALLQRDKVPTCLDIVGTGPEQTFLERRARQRLEEHTFVFHGHGDAQSLHHFYSTCDVFALPSIHEGLGRVYYEAMARGLPVVATWVDGIVDVVLDGVTGLLVPPNDPRALSQALYAIISQPALRQRLIRNGYANARRFLVDEFITNLLEWIIAKSGIEFERRIVSEDKL